MYYCVYVVDLPGVYERTVGCSTGPFPVGERWGDHGPIPLRCNRHRKENRRLAPH